MSLFIPRNQLRNMFENEANRALTNQPNTNINRLIAFASLLNEQQHNRNNLHVSDNWLEDNWMDDY